MNSCKNLLPSNIGCTLGTRPHFYVCHKCDISSTVWVDSQGHTFQIRVKQHKSTFNNNVNFNKEDYTLRDLQPMEYSPQVSQFSSRRTSLILKVD